MCTSQKFDMSCVDGLPALLWNEDRSTDRISHRFHLYFLTNIQFYKKKKLNGFFLAKNQSKRSMVFPGLKFWWAPTNQMAAILA